MTHKIGSDSDFRDAFLYGAARAFFVTAYADACEAFDSRTENDCDACGETHCEEHTECDLGCQMCHEALCDECETLSDLPRAGAGEDWMDVAPDAPPNAYALAGELWSGLATLNPGGCGVYTLAARATEADGVAPDPEKFGHYLAMQAMGHGVSWFDDHKPFEIECPRMECSSYTFSTDAYRGEE